MVSVVMEGVVVMNSFPPGAVPSTCWPEEESLERGERERVPDTPATSATWARGIPRYQVTGSVSRRTLGEEVRPHTDQTSKGSHRSSSSFQSFYFTKGK